MKVTRGVGDCLQRCFIVGLGTIATIGSMLADRAPELRGRDQVENRMKPVTQKAIE
jgi:hypothetical protein